MNTPLVQLTLVQFREFFRHPGIIFWALLFPILMAWVLGIAFTQKTELVKNVAVVQEPGETNVLLNSFIEDAQKGSEDSKYDFSKKIKNEQLGDVTYQFQYTNWDKAIQLMKRGKISIILQETRDSLRYHFDPKNPDGQLTYLQLNAAIKNDKFNYEYGTIKPLTEVGTRYIDFLIPGLIAMNIMNSCLWGISYALIDMRTKKLLRRMVATPMKKSTFLISHFLARVSLASLEVFLLFIFAYFFFKVTIEGSLAALVLVFLAGNICFTGVAMLIASKTSNTRIGTGLINAVVMPMMILSGIFFSYHNFPEWSINFIRLLPLTMLADGIRSIFIEGAGFAETIVETASLTGIGIVLFVVGLRVYRWY